MSFEQLKLRGVRMSESENRGRSTLPPGTIGRRLMGVTGFRTSSGPFPSSPSPGPGFGSGDMAGGHSVASIISHPVTTNVMPSSGNMCLMSFCIVVYFSESAVTRRCAVSLVSPRILYFMLYLIFDTDTGSLSMNSAMARLENPAKLYNATR